jgi:hypothetical protein
VDDQLHQGVFFWRQPSLQRAEFAKNTRKARPETLMIGKRTALGGETVSDRRSYTRLPVATAMNLMTSRRLRSSQD